MTHLDLVPWQKAWQEERASQKSELKAAKAALKQQQQASAEAVRKFKQKEQVLGAQIAGAFHEAGIVHLQALTRMHAHACTRTHARARMHAQHTYHRAHTPRHIMPASVGPGVLVTAEKNTAREG